MPKRQKREPSGDYEVGYGRPPKHSQFKKGEKQNHERKRTEDHDLGGYIQEELGTLATFKDEEGRRRRMPKARLLAKQIVNHAVKTGDPRRLQMYLPKPSVEPDEPFTEAELETILRALEQLVRKGEPEEEA